MTLIAQIAFPILFLWFVGLLLSFFRKDLEPHWKFFFFLLFCFYLIQFFPYFLQGIERWKGDPKTEIIVWLTGMAQAIYVFLFLLWPIVLIRIFYSASGNLSKTLIPVLSYFTILFWVLFFLWSIFPKEWNEILQSFMPKTP